MVAPSHRDELDRVGTDEAKLGFRRQFIVVVVAAVMVILGIALGLSGFDWNSGESANRCGSIVRLGMML